LCPSGPRGHRSNPGRSRNPFCANNDGHGDPAFHPKVDVIVEFISPSHPPIQVRKNREFYERGCQETFFSVGWKRRSCRDIRVTICFKTAFPWSSKIVPTHEAPLRSIYGRLFYFIARTGWNWEQGQHDRGGHNRGWKGIALIRN